MRLRLTAVTYDFVLLDLNLREERGLDGLAMILNDAPFTKVYVLTAHGTVQCAVEALRRGACGFFEKGSDTRQLLEELSQQTHDSVLTETDLDGL